MGHLTMAKTSLKSLNLDEVVFIPCGNPPHKEQNSIWDAKFRLDMTKLLIEDEIGLSVSDMEIQSNEKSYTAKTLAKLKGENPDTQFYFIVGADSLCYMDEWKTPEIIFENAEIIALGRKGYNEKVVNDYIGLLQEKYDAVIHNIFMENVDISSSEIREKLKKGEDVSQYTGEKIYKYILENINEF